MQHNHSVDDQDHQQKHGWSRANIALIGFLAIAGFYLIAEHRAHVLPYLPFLLLLACPLLHVFMHGGHGGNDDGKPPQSGGHQH